MTDIIDKQYTNLMFFWGKMWILFMLIILAGFIAGFFIYLTAPKSYLLTIWVLWFNDIGALIPVGAGCLIGTMINYYITKRNRVRV